jgi:hypothetical protein
MLQAEGVEHPGGALESNPSALLPDGECCGKDGYKPILPPWQAIARVACNPEQKLSVPAFVHQTAADGAPHRQTAKHERAGREAEILPGTLAPQAHALDRFDTAQPSFRDQQVGNCAREQRPDALRAATGWDLNDSGTRSGDLVRARLFRSLFNNRRGGVSSWSKRLVVI